MRWLVDEFLKVLKALKVTIIYHFLSGAIVVDESTWCLGSIRKGAEQLGSIDITLIKREGQLWGKLEEG